MEILSFDHWGRRRNATNWTYTGVPTSFTFDRGYTGHEHLDIFALINMNGRIYDPATAHFLSPDNYVQNPNSTQNYNKYGYCLNNPLKYKDPSGNKLAWLDLFALVDPVYAGRRLDTDDPCSPDEALRRSFSNHLFRGIPYNTYTRWYNKNHHPSTEPRYTPTSQPGEKYTYTDPATGTEYCGYYFDDFESMVIYMWERSNNPNVNVEISGYILVDKSGNYSYWVFDEYGNTLDNSNNPNFTSSNHEAGYRMFDNKRIVAQVHTHPTLFYEQKGKPYGYDGPSYKDQQAANAFNAPVYTIGPTTVSVIFPHEGHSEDYYKNLSFGDYNFYETRYDVNPFYISEQSTWLENPYFYEYW